MHLLIYTQHKIEFPVSACMFRANFEDDLKNFDAVFSRKI